MTGQVTTAAWLGLPRWERQRRVAEYRAADEALQINSYEERQAGVREETENYHLLNSWFWSAYLAIPWWSRLHW